MVDSIKSVLMRRDGIDPDEAERMIEDAKEELRELVEAGDLMGAEDLCQDHFGLEPDYMDELLLDLY